MKLKNIIYSLFGASALLMAACNEIDSDDRFIYVEPVEVGRKVLIEDFTGQKCINCPAAIDKIEMMVQQYGEENVIAVGIHSGVRHDVYTHYSRPQDRDRTGVFRLLAGGEPALRPCQPRGRCQA